jgi:arginyl-tRNA synthetase
MVKYVSQKTGAIIETECQLLGDWVKVEGRSSEEEKAKIEDRGSDEGKVNTYVPDKVTDTMDAKKIVEVVVEEFDDSADGIDGITVKQIKQELDAFGIKYDPRFKKQELYELMLNGK